MTAEQIEAHENSGHEYHRPALASCTGSVATDELNICCICGVQITQEPGFFWVEVDDETADKLRREARLAAEEWENAHWR